MYYIAVFENARAVIRAERLAREAGIKTTVSPVPETISSECGMCLKITAPQLDEFKNVINDAKIKVVLSSIQ